MRVWSRESEMVLAYRHVRNGKTVASCTCVYVLSREGLYLYERKSERVSGFASESGSMSERKLKRVSACA